MYLKSRGEIKMGFFENFFRKEFRRSSKGPFEIAACFRSVKLLS